MKSVLTTTLIGCLLAGAMFGVLLDNPSNPVAAGLGLGFGVFLVVTALTFRSWID